MALPDPRWGWHTPAANRQSRQDREWRTQAFEDAACRGPRSVSQSGHMPTNPGNGQLPLCPWPDRDDQRGWPGTCTAARGRGPGWRGPQAGQDQGRDQGQDQGQGQGLADLLGGSPGAMFTVLAAPPRLRRTFRSYAVKKPVL